MDEPGSVPAPSGDDSREVHQTSYQILWFPVVIVLGFLGSVVTLSVLPDNEHQQAFHFGSAGSALVVYGVGLAPFLFVLLASLWRWVRFRWIARAEDRVVQADPELVAGPVVVTGTVVTRSDPVAVRLAIEQRRRDDGLWHETARRITSHEFDIRLPSGQLLAVVPDDKLRLMDDLDQIERHDETRRTRSAELAAGEPVYAVGELAESAEVVGQPRADYRAAPQRAVELRAPARGRLLLSTKPLGSRFGVRATSYGRWLGATLIAVVTLQAGLFFAYHASTHFGVPRRAKLIGKQAIEQKNDAGEETGIIHQIHAVAAGTPPYEIREDASRLTFDRLQPGDDLWLRLVPGWSSSGQIGRWPTIMAPLVFPTAFVAGLWLVLFFRLAGGKRPWYERPKLVNDAEP